MSSLAVLKEVVEDFHEDQLHLDFAGHIQLKDIHLKREALRGWRCRWS